MKIKLLKPFNFKEGENGEIVQRQSGEIVDCTYQVAKALINAKIATNDLSKPKTEIKTKTKTEVKNGK